MAKGTITDRAVPRAVPRIRRGYFECRYGQLHVHNAIPPGGGFDEGTPLLAIHPGGASGALFLQILPLIGRDRSVYAPDLPGCGNSDPASGPLSAEEQAAALGDFLDSMRVRQIDVIGYRDGSLVAVDLALARPAAVRRLVCAGVPRQAVQEDPYRERLGRIRQPALVLHAGDEDRDAAARARDLIRTSKLLELSEVEPFGRAAARTAEVLRVFLAPSRDAQAR